MAHVVLFRDSPVGSAELVLQLPMAPPVWVGLNETVFPVANIRQLVGLPKYVLY